MAEERIHTTDDGTAPATHTTIIHETAPRSGGSGAGIVIALALLIAVVGGIYLYSQSSVSEAAKDNAIASAAGEVGNAANKVGNAAEDAAGALANKGS